MKSVLFLTFLLNLRIPLIAYVFLFFIPILSQGKYYEITSLNFIFNKIVLTLVFFYILASSTYIIFFKKVCHDVMFIYILGIAMIVFNMISLAFVEDMNFIVTGFALMLAPLIYSLKIYQLQNFELLDNKQYL